MYKDDYHSIIFSLKKNGKPCSIIKAFLSAWDIKWPITHPIINVYSMTLGSALDIC